MHKCAFSSVLRKGGKLAIALALACGWTPDVRATTTAPEIDVAEVVDFTGDADVDIGTDRVYTHLLDGGSHNPVATVNGVTFQKWGATTGTTTGTDGKPYTWTTTINTSNGGNNPGVASSNGIYDLLYAMQFHFGVEEDTFTLGGLTPGQAYELRIYQRPWGLNTDRVGNFVFSSASGNDDAEISYNSDRTSAMRAQYVRYRYVAPASGEAGFTVTYPNTGNTIHFYGITNEEIDYAPPTAFPVRIMETTGGTIIVSADAEPDENGKYEIGTTLTLTAVPDEGSCFLKWDVAGLTDEQAANPELTLTVNQALRVGACFESAEWVFDSETKILTDGNWSFTAMLEGGDEKKEITVMKYTVAGGAYLNFNKPVRDGYTIRILNQDLLRSPGYGGPAGLEEVILPSTLRRFYNALFAHSATVRKVTFTDGLPDLTSIGTGNMIHSCTALKELVFHAQNLTSMPEGTLANCGSIVSLTITCPSMPRLANNLMTGDTSLAELTFDTPNTFTAAGVLVNNSPLRKLTFMGPMPDKVAVVKHLAEKSVAGDYTVVIYRSTWMDGWENLVVRPLTEAEEALTSKPVVEGARKVEICEEFAGGKKIWVVDLPSPYDPERGDTVTLSADAMTAGSGGTVTISPMKASYALDETVTLTAATSGAHGATFLGWEGKGTVELSAEQRVATEVSVSAFAASELVARFQCDWWLADSDTLTDGNWKFKVAVDGTDITILYEQRDREDFDGGAYLDLTRPIEGGYTITALGNHALRGDGYYDINGRRQEFGSRVNAATIKIPTSVTDLGQECIAWNPQLVNLEIDFSPVVHFGYRCLAFNQTLEFALNENSFASAEVIENYAFSLQMLSDIMSRFKLVGPVVMPKIKTIGLWAFYQQPITRLEINSPELESIATYAFHQDTALTSAVIAGGKYTTAAEGIFNGCSRLESLVIDSPVFGQIDHAGLANMRGLKTMEIYTKQKAIRAIPFGTSYEPFTNDCDMEKIVFGGPMPGLDVLDLAVKSRNDYKTAIFFDPRCAGWDAVTIAAPTDEEWSQLPAAFAAARESGKVLGLYTTTTQGYTKRVWMIKTKSKYAPQRLILSIR